jgi:GMT-like protein
MKGIMARQSSAADQEVPSLPYNPADKRFPLLFERTHPLHDLESMLLKDFAGRSLPRHTLYEKHRVGKPYILKNYHDILRTLEHTGNIITEPPAGRRPPKKGEVPMSEPPPRHGAGSLARKK